MKKPCTVKIFVLQCVEDTIQVVLEINTSAYVGFHGVQQERILK